MCGWVAVRTSWWRGEHACACVCLGCQQPHSGHCVMGSSSFPHPHINPPENADTPLHKYLIAAWFTAAFCRVFEFGQQTRPTGEHKL